MELFLVRHAVAVPRATESHDHARPLSARGRRRFEKQVRGLDRIGIGLDRVYHSPHIRAVQTAELLDPITEGERTPIEGLAASPVASLLTELTGDHIAVVGHEPFLGELCSLLVVGTTSSAASFPLRKGGVAHLSGEVTPGGCVVRAVYLPRTLRLAGQ